MGVKTLDEKAIFIADDDDDDDDTLPGTNAYEEEDDGTKDWTDDGKDDHVVTATRTPMAKESFIVYSFKERS